MPISIDDGVTAGTYRGISGSPFTSNDVSGSPTACVDAPPTGQKLVITDLVVSVAVDLQLTFTEETSGTVVLSGWFPANCGCAQLTPRGKVKMFTAGKRLMVQASGAGAVSILVVGYPET